MITASVLLLADEGAAGQRYSDEEIVEALNVSSSTISRIRERFVAESVIPSTGDGHVRLIGDCGPRKRWHGKYLSG